MSFFDKFKSAIGLARKSSDGLTGDRLLEMLSGSSLSRTGRMVSWNNALCVSAVFGCVRVVAEDIAKVEFRLDRHIGREINPALDHPLYELLAFQPNAWMTSFEFREMLTTFAMLAGDGIAYKTRSPVDNRILEMIPIPPPWVYIHRPVGKWEPEYTITFPNGGGTIRCGMENIFHLRGPSLDGYKGAEIMRIAREAVGLALAGEEHQSNIARGAVQGSGYLTTQNALTQKQVDEVREFLKTKGGVKNANETPVFQMGLEYKELGATGQKAEIMATREFQIPEICRFLRVFPQMVGFSDKTGTYGSAEQFFMAHVIHSLQPWAARWEQTTRRDCLTPAERKLGYMPNIVLEDLLRGDPKARGQYYKDRRETFSITPNEIRIREGDNPFADPKFDEPIGPVNVGLLGDKPEDDEEGDDKPPRRRPASSTAKEPEEDNDDDQPQD